MAITEIQSFQSIPVGHSNSHLPIHSEGFFCHRHFCDIMRCILKKTLRLCPTSRRAVSFRNPKTPYIPDIRTKVVIFVLSASYSSTSGTRIPIDTAMSGFSKSLWDGSDKSGFDSLDHPGYSMESNPENFTGGWYAHRKVWEKTENDEPSGDWVKDIIGDVTKVDYQSMEIGRAPRILVLYGSLRPTSFSRKCGRFYDSSPGNIGTMRFGSVLPTSRIVCCSFLLLSILFHFCFFNFLF